MSKRKKSKKRSLSKRRQHRQLRKLEQRSRIRTQFEANGSVRKRKKSKLGERVKVGQSRLQAWYLNQSLVLKVALGLIIIPILIALFLLQGVILPFLATAMGIAFAISKVAFIWLKGGAFIVYISYKVFKGLLGVYYCVSRSLVGLKAHNLRNRQAVLPMSDDAEYPALRLSNNIDMPVHLKASWKIMRLELGEDSPQILFSYLRYFIIGQIYMYRCFWFERMRFLTLWKSESRDKVKEIFTLIGQTIFTPHMLGPHLNKKRLLVPGDARLLEIKLAEETSRLIGYHFEVTWQDWIFNKRWPFLSATKQRRDWHLKTPTSLASISEDEIGYIQSQESTEA